jgi:hypothetical protein
MTRLAPVVLVALASAASAQQPLTQDSRVTYALSWTEAPGGNGNGLLDPGESAVIHLTASFSNQNATGSFSPHQGPYSSGTIRGLGFGFIDLVGVGLTQGTWDVTPANGYGVAAAWALDANGNGTSTNNGSTLANLQFGQFPSSAAQINATNPVVDIFTGKWTPASYAAGYREFHVTAASIAGIYDSSVLFATTGGTTVSAFTGTDFGYTVITFPAPSGLALFALAPFLARRRRPVHKE